MDKNFKPSYHKLNKIYKVNLKNMIYNCKFHKLNITKYHMNN